MSQRISDVTQLKQAIANSAGAVGALVATAVDGTGFSRARFIFSFGNVAGTGALSAGIGVYEASTSGATFTAIASGSMAAVSSGVISAGTNNVMSVDVPIKATKPWLKVSGGSMLSAAVTNSCVVELYNSVNYPPTRAEQQVVVV
jgi:hypothetical protein